MMYGFEIVTQQQTAGRTTEWKKKCDGIKGETSHMYQSILRPDHSDKLHTEHTKYNKLVR